MIFDYLILLTGFALLAKGGEYLVRGGSELSTIFGISPLLIGLGVAAMGTSAPEAAVSIKAALSNHSAVSMGNILGSNIANICLALGLSSLLYGQCSSGDTIRKEVSYSFIAVLVLLLFCLDPFSSGETHRLSSMDGFFLLVLFCGYLFYLVRMARQDRRESRNKKENSSKFSPGKFTIAASMTVGGIIGVVVGGHFVVDSAVKIARAWNVSNTMISVTVVALGTSLPEVATTIAAARKKLWDIALGNVVGSNIFNILLVLGIASVIRPLNFPDFGQLVLPDILVVCFVTILLLLFLSKNRMIGRIKGGWLLLVYVAYIVFVVVRG
jgi:cation:H+ antiporter